MKETHFAQEVAAFLDIAQEQDFSLENPEELYMLSYQCYESSDYANAAQFFTKLVLCYPFTAKYWCGLASSQQMQKQYLAAIHAWSIAALLEEKDPLPHFHAAECFFSLQEKQDALKALQAAESLLDAESALRDKIEVLKKVHFDE